MRLGRGVINPSRVITELLEVLICKPANFSAEPNHSLWPRQATMMQGYRLLDSVHQHLPSETSAINIRTRLTLVPFRFHRTRSWH